MRNDVILVILLPLVSGFSFLTYEIQHKEAMAQGAVNTELAKEEQSKQGPKKPKGPNDGGGGKPKLVEVAKEEQSKQGPKGPHDGGGSGRLHDAREGNVTFGIGFLLA